MASDSTMAEAMGVRSITPQSEATRSCISSDSLVGLCGSRQLNSTMHTPPITIGSGVTHWLFTPIKRANMTFPALKSKAAMRIGTVYRILVSEY